MDRELRYERKWIYKSNFYLNLVNCLFRSKLKFKNQFQKRIVNSIYFDDSNLTNIIDNVEGQKNRVKYRLRWYESKKFIINPIFETKYKQGFKTFKTKKNINIKGKIPIDNLKKVLNEVTLNFFKGKKLEPKILINYERDYYISSNNLIRATVDNNIMYKKLNKFSSKFFNKFNNTILEMKYDTDLDNYFRYHIDNVNVRYSKSSKYVNCMLTNSREFTL